MKEANKAKEIEISIWGLKLKGRSSLEFPSVALGVFCVMVTVFAMAKAINYIF